jgi:hypothetical protein
VLTHVSRKALALMALTCSAYRQRTISTISTRRGDKSPEIILTLKLILRDLPQEVIRFAV